MSGADPRLPMLSRLLLRLLSGTERQRARDDLVDVRSRIEATRGAAAARRACARESFWIVIWSGVEGLRRVKAGLPGRSSGPGGMKMGILQDVRFACRALARRPAFTAMVTGVLALGIGANVAIFTLADRLFLADPPLVQSPDELVRMFRSWAPGQGGALSYPDYEDYRDGNSTLTGLMAYGDPYAATARSGAGSAPADVMVITPNYFDVLGIEPAAGRFFRADENVTPGGDPVAIVSHDYWRDRMAGSADAIGSVVMLNGNAFTVVGVAPAGFRGLTPGETAPAFWIPVMMRDAVLPSSNTAWRERIPDQRYRWVSVVGRLAPGRTVAAAQTEMSVIAERIHALEGDAANREETALVTPRFRWYPSSHTDLLGLTRVLVVTVALLLAIAIANVTILLLARATARVREIGIRSALGAGRRRVAQQMLVESALLGLGGCVIGVFLSIGAARIASTLVPVDLAGGAWPDRGVLLFAVVLSLGTALLAGALPALRATRTDVAGMIHGRDRGTGGGPVRDGLVVVQVALSLVLVAGAALFARSLATARAVDVGFDLRGVVFVGVNLRSHGYDEPHGRAFVDEALDRIRAVPGVAIATISRQVPFRGDWSTDMQPWAGHEFAGGRDVLTTGLNQVGPRYFEAMGMPLLRGRAFDESDGSRGDQVIVVNETFARLAFPDGDALGRRVPIRSEQPDAEVIGIVRDAKYYGLNEDAWPQIYVASGQVYQSQTSFLVKTSGDPASLASAVLKAIHDVDPDIAFTSIETLEGIHAEQTARFRASASVVGLSGLIALLLASAGLYGIMSYRVSRATREIGVRMAIGATRGDVAAGVLRRSLALVLAGVVLGLAGAYVLSRFVEGMVFGVPAQDPVSLITAPLVLVVVSMLAALAPAHRASRIDPMLAMRAD